MLPPADQPRPGSPNAPDVPDARGSSPAPVRRLPRAERRAQILDAATRAFARSGFAATGLDDVAAEAGITRVLLYRHFESKADLYRSVLTRACERLAAAVGSDISTDDPARLVGPRPELRPEAIPALLQAAAADPDAFRLLNRHAAREPEFRDLIDELNAASTQLARHNLARILPPGPWLDWAAGVLTPFTMEAVIAWLDAGQPDPDEAAVRIGVAIDGIIAAARLVVAKPGDVPGSPS